MNSTSSILLVYGLLFLISTTATILVVCAFPVFQRLITISRALTLNLLFSHLLLNTINTPLMSKIIHLLSNEIFGVILKGNLLSALQILHIELFWYTLIVNSVLSLLNRLPEGNNMFVWIGVITSSLIIWAAAAHASIFYHHNEFQIN